MASACPTTGSDRRRQFNPAVNTYARESRSGGDVSQITHCRPPCGDGPGDWRIGAASGPSVPDGIVVVCALTLLVDLIVFFEGVAGLGSDALAPILVAVAVVDVVVVYGLFTLKHWGWTWAVVTGALAVVFAFVPPGSSLLAATLAATVTGYVVSKRSVYELARDRRRICGS